MAAQPIELRGHNIAPPRCAYTVFKKLFREMKANGRQPHTVDRSAVIGVLGNGGFAYDAHKAVRYFGHVDSAEKPTPLWTEFVEAIDTPKWAPLMARIMRSRWPGIFSLNLETCPRTAFHHKLAEVHTGNNIDYGKFYRFLRDACKDVGIELGNNVLEAQPKDPQRRVANRSAPTSSKDIKNGDVAATTIHATEAEVVTAAQSRGTEIEIIRPLQTTLVQEERKKLERSLREKLDAREVVVTVDIKF